MARKSNQQKNGVDRRGLNHKKWGSDFGGAQPDVRGHGKVSEVKVFPGEEELPNGSNPDSALARSMSKTNYSGDEHKSKRKPVKQSKKDKQEMNGINGEEQPKPLESDSGECNANIDGPSVAEENGSIPHRYQGRNHRHSRLPSSFNGLHIHNLLESIENSDNAVVRKLKASALAILKATNEWMERQKPLFIRFRNKIQNAQLYAKTKFGQAYPIVLKWLMNFGSIILVILMVWLDCALRGIDSFLRLGTSSFFSLIWCSVFSVIAMAGMFKFLLVFALAALIGVFVGFTFGIITVAISGTVLLWLYGSFWTTMLVIFLGGLTFALSRERMALLITTMYSVYCAWTYVGFLGLILALNLTFISTDILIYFLKNNMNQHRRPNGPAEQTPGMQGQPGFFNSEHVHASFSETGPGVSPDRSPGVPSTSGVDSDMNSEDEVVRLLKCADHYSVLGFSRYENMDVSLLKREYRKKAMLVHPDKNMGNEKAVEAFKKLQNAYEILLDSVKRKAYDDELRKEEILNIFHRFQSSSQEKGGHGFFDSGMARSEADGDDPLLDSRRIACKKCNNFHLWIHTRKSKSQARWCQECKDFHQAKDGDGWVEQSSQPFFFGLLQKVDAPAAFVCADSKIYNATEWYICQGMRCLANTHKPSFHVNTSITSKYNTGKGSTSGQRGGRIPTSVEDCMTEEEFFEWFQNAMQSGMFDNMNASSSNESPSSKAGNSAKSGSNGGGNKKKKKGKKQW